MILSCNSCEKKFVVPDSAIGPSGRLVQCSSCGNKWKQFPNNEVAEKKTVSKLKPEPKKIQKKVLKKLPNSISNKKKKIKKKSGPDLYSPEYLAKKHGIKLGEETSIKKDEKKKNKDLNFGFYNYLLVYSIILVFILRLIYFTESSIIYYLPFAEIYIEYMFETLNNIKDIIVNFLNR